MATQAGLRIRMVPTRHAVHADPHFLESILRNFISNARRYTVKGGVLIGARARGDRVRIEVWDTGPGIPDDKLPALFDEFRCFADTDNAGIRGAGLGLSVAKRMGDLMGAEMTVRSTVGKGSLFAVTLPMATPQPNRLRNATSPAPVDPGEAIRGLNVLCVDDEKSIREGMAALLESFGCTVYLAENPDQAMDLVTAKRPVVVIADQRLGTQLEGADLLAALKEQEGGMVCALLTASSAPEVSEKAASMGIPIFRKPVDPAALRSFLERAVMARPEAAE